MLTEMKKKDREAMALMVDNLCQERGVSVSRAPADELDEREVALDLSYQGVQVRVEFDGTKGLFENRDLYCLAWHTLLNGSAKMTDAFGLAAGADVNPHHRAKCTAFADGIDALLDQLRAVFDCIDRGLAFQHQTPILAA